MENILLVSLRKPEVGAKKHFDALPEAKNWHTDTQYDEKHGMLMHPEPLKVGYRLRYCRNYWVTKASKLL